MSKAEEKTAGVEDTLCLICFRISSSITEIIYSDAQKYRSRQVVPAPYHVYNLKMFELLKSFTRFIHSRVNVTLRNAIYTLQLMQNQYKHRYNMSILPFRKLYHTKYNSQI